MKKILILVLVFVLIFTSCSNKPENTNNDNNQTNAGDNNNNQGGDVTAPDNSNSGNGENTENNNSQNTTNEDENNFTLTSEIIPLDVGDNEDITAKTCKINIEAGEKFENLKNTIAEINTWIESTAKKDLEMLFEYAEMDTDSELEKFYSIDDNISFIRQDDKYVSFSLLRYENTGGVHPSTMGAGFTIDVESGKRLNLKDIVSNPDDLYDIILDKLNKHEAKVGFYNDYESSVKKLFYGDESTEFQLVWVIDDRTLYINFEPYVIAPYATGPVNITISFNEVENLFIDSIKEN